jgi:UDP-glucose 4-epimerase
VSRILVTGGAGYVGSVCSTELLRQGHKVAIVDDLSAGHRAAVPHLAQFYGSDIGDAEAMTRIVRAFGPEVVFHFAAKAVIPESVTNPAVFYKVNLISAYSMLEVLRKEGVNKLIFSSTAACYGNPTSIPISEDHPKHPVNSYGESKLAFERMLAWYAHAYGMSVVAFRYFNASGAIEGVGEMHQPETPIIPLLFEAACGERSAFSIYGTDWDTPDGTCLRDYVHVLDIAQAHILALRWMDKPGFADFNIGTGTSYSVKDVVKTVQEVIGQKIPVIKAPRRPGDPAVLCADAQKLMREFDWKPKYSDLTHIIKTAWAWKQTVKVNSANNKT